jgi:hypothetical protein
MLAAVGGMLAAAGEIKAVPAELPYRPNILRSKVGKSSIHKLERLSFR